MKKRITIVIVAIIALLSVGSLIFAESRHFEGEESAVHVGHVMKEAMKDLMTENEAEFFSEKSENTVAIVMGENVSKEYFDLKIKLCQIIDADGAEKRAWDIVKNEVYERKFAEEHGIMPTEAEIRACSEDMRTVVESTEESHAIVKSLISELGMTEDEYWNEYQLRYEAPVQMIRNKVYQYCQDNNIEFPTPDEIEGEILDITYTELIEED